MYFNSETVQNDSFACQNIVLGELLSDTMESKKENTMSLTGIILTKDGIVAFGDTKSSIRDRLGNLMEEKRTVRKVFSYATVVLTTSGTNEFFSENYQKVRIDDWLIKQSKSPYEFLPELCDEIGKVRENLGNAYSFMLGTKEYVRCCEIRNGQLHYERKMQKKDVYLQGNSYLMQLMFPHITLYPENQTAKEMQKEIVEAFRKTMEDGTAVGTYVPAGYPVFGVIWDEKGKKEFVLEK